MSDEDSDNVHLAIPTELKNGEEFEVVQVLATDHIDDVDDEEENEIPAKRQRTEDEPEEEESKDVVELDLVNFALVRCEGAEGDGSGQAKYQLVPANTSGASEGQQQVYVIDETEVQSVEQVNTEYVAMVEGNDAAQSLVIMEYPDGQEEIQEEDTMSPALLAQVMHDDEPSLSVDRPKPRSRYNTLPPLHVMLSSPNLRLYLYSCRQCTFKCNAIKELTEHKKQSHAVSNRSPGNRWRNVTQKPMLHQCAKCPYKAVSNAMLQKHMNFSHRNKVEDANSSESSSSSNNDKDEDAVVDLLVCAACGFESKDQEVFRKHVQRHKRLRK